MPAPGGAVADREQLAELALGRGDRRREAGAAQGALRRHGPSVPRVAGRSGRGPPDPAGLPVGRVPARHPRPGAGARDPVRRGPAREPRTVRGRQLLRLDPARGVELHARGAVAGTRHRVDHAAPRQRGGDRRAARHPRRHDPGRAHPRRLLHRRRLQARGATRRSRASPTGTPGALPEVDSNHDGRSSGYRE